MAHILGGNYQIPQTLFFQINEYKGHKWQVNKGIINKKCG
jgi:hypothetical protein